MSPLPKAFTHLATDDGVGFAQRTAAFKAARSTLYPRVPYDPQESPYPLFVPPERISELFALFAALHPALVGLVRGWWSHPEWQTTVPLKPKVERVLRRLDIDRPYTKVGSLRPDYIIPPRDDQPLRICEINARFMFNGHFNAVVQDAAMDQAGLLGPWQPSTLNGRDIIDAFDDLADPSKPIYVVAGSELADRLARHGLAQYIDTHKSIRVVDPGVLTVGPNGELTNGSETMDQVMLQLQQTELEALDEDVLLALGRVCHNDLRTIYIVHDKRTLGVLLGALPELVTSGIIDSHKAAVLERGIAETRPLGYPCHPRSQWVLKKATSGKGDGMVFGKNVSEDEWTAVLNAGTHVLQRYYPTLKVKLRVPEGVLWPVVGTFMVINARMLGTTTFRANDADSIALSTGGVALVGATVPGTPRSFTVRNHKHLLPPKGSCIDADATLSPKYLSNIRASLAIHGLALLRLRFPDPNSAHLAAVSGGLGTALTHSSSAGALWDITPSAATAARSHGTEEFPWHTDCSFESSPPRYFGLHVVRPDRFQGGFLRVLAVDDLLADLPEEIVATLRRNEFRFSVPNEFDKGVPFTTGAVLSGNRIRWRRDIMSGTTEAAEQALAAVDDALARLPGLVLGPDEMRAGVIVCMDNGRWLHARSPVHDMHRLLRRVRWGPEPFASV